MNAMFRRFLKPVYIIIKFNFVRNILKMHFWDLPNG